MLDSSELEKSFEPRKRVVIGVIGATCLLVLIIGFLLWWVPSVGLSSIHPTLPAVLGVIVAVTSLIILGGLSLLILTLLLGRDLFFSQRLRGIVIKYLFSVITALGRLLGVDKDKLQQSFIALNNELVRSKKLRVPANRVMILLPHCVQLFDCAIKITGDVNQCVACGRCDIQGLARVAKAYGVDIAVATGGTIARKLIVERRPKLILAVACERDLTSGIRDTYPLPVIGIHNRRPNGPCFNTRVVVEEVEQVLREHIVSE